MSRPRFWQTAWAVQRHPHAGRAELQAYQDARLRRLVLHAYENVPYYRKLFDRHRVHPRHIRGTVDLDLIPISSKQELRELPAAALTDRSVNPRRLLSVWTSGSTGEPFMVRRTWLEQGFNVLFRDRCQKAFGLRLTDRIMTVGRGRGHDPKESKLVGRAMRAIGIHPTLRVDGMSPPEEIVRRLETFRPHMLVALPGVLCLTADYLLATGRQDIRPRILLVGGEVLTPLMRRRLTEAFGVEPVQTYASHEFPMMGWECRASGEIHVCDDAVILEVLRDGRPALPGEDGEVVATNLHAYAMPFIRYRLADVVTRGSEQCGCGQPFSTIRAIRGRMIDYFSLPDGRRLHPYRILERLLPGGDAWIRQYQLLQDRPDRIVMQVVPSEAPTLEMQERIARAVGPLLGSGIEFQVRLVEAIPLEPGGKYRHSRSLISSAYEPGVDAIADV
jgi:phenylacetate-coenzyme A ligase PaaK-like adenylate-forming protein